ncbi:hypothetical protein F0L68_15970 [Solihabitans fulvus]|uniref:Uncharacterized protein n=1 Tax=Solihabitans fulvus TaxID=1892852 RepID=A0A5B2XEV0_9PSEU|nr:DUF6153 family protein [Solihabitans fulvus]KAA2261575.1 hypothetical protein F0L68_15970 [Solihabitans fulvus]
MAIITTTERRGRHGRDAVRAAALRWVLLCALVLGVAAMHHLVAGDPMSSAMPAPTVMAHAVDAGGPPCCGDDRGAIVELSGADGMGGHDMLHLCLAVLVAAAALMLAGLLVRRGRLARASNRVLAVIATAGRGPPSVPRTAELLSSLCVLRL